MREYELAVIYDLAVTEAGGAEASVETLTSAVEARGGKILKVDHWGRRRMAYPIGRSMDGDYIISRVELEPTAVTALEAALRIDERVFRHLVVRADELPPPPPVREPRRDPEQQTGMGEPTTEIDAAMPAAEVAVEPSDAATSDDTDVPVAEAAAEPEVAAVEPEQPAAADEAEAPMAEVTGEPEQPATVAEAETSGEAEASAAEPVAAEPGEDVEEGEAPPSGTIAEPEDEAEANEESRA